MSVTITLEDIRAYAEVNYIINHMNVKYKEMIPEKILTFFSEFSDPNHNINLNPYIPLQNQGLQRYTLEIIALLHLKYWCENEERKKELYDIMLENQAKLDSQMSSRFNVENLFEIPEEVKQDFSAPKVVQKFEIYKENNDIEDFTDSVEVHEENSLVENTIEEKKGFFAMIKDKVLSLFHKL